MNSVDKSPVPSDVHDRESFIRFALALADEQRLAAKVRDADPEAYIKDGVSGWMNHEINGFLYSAMVYFPDESDAKENTEPPSWRTFAEILWCGKTV